MKMLMIVGVVLLLTPGGAFASTFVGNGGNAGDIELQVAINQIFATVKKIAEDKDESLKLCTCYERVQAQPVCNQLRNLNQAQVGFCAAQLQEKSGELIKILNDPENVRFNWTTENIDVVERRGVRGADAVTNPKTRTVTLNPNTFLQRNPQERFFLLAHELFHLTKLQGAPLADDQAYPPFASQEGGRQLINAMASSLLIESLTYGTFGSEELPLLRSQNIKRHWFSLGLAQHTQPADGGSAYEVSPLRGGSLRYRHQFGTWGLVGSLEFYQGTKDILSATKIEQSRSILGLGVAYRWFPFSDPMSFLGQSHFVFDMRAELHNGKIKVSDGYVEISEDTSAVGGSLNATYLLPSMNGFWGYVQVGASSAPLKYEKFDLKYSMNTSGELGVAYAF